MVALPQRKALDTRGQRSMQHLRSEHWGNAGCRHRAHGPHMTTVTRHSKNVMLFRKLSCWCAVNGNLQHANGC